MQVTTCDSDTLFPPKYFEALTADYYAMKKRCDPRLHSTVWQAPLLYNWSLNLSSVFVRVTALLRSVMTAGLLIPFSVNPMSCFSFSLECAVRGGFWHPQVGLIWTHTLSHCPPYALCSYWWLPLSAFQATTPMYCLLCLTFPLSSSPLHIFVLLRSTWTTWGLF